MTNVNTPYFVTLVIGGHLRRPLTDGTKLLSNKHQKLDNAHLKLLTYEYTQKYISRGGNYSSLTR